MSVLVSPRDHRAALQRGAPGGGRTSNLGLLLAVLGSGLSGLMAVDF